ncbi:MAG: hypothetical protein JW804_05520 [Sedimentisphaerales bacterium]|nr:hypothetical protein [Sedimentisphaerales bacterium]
MTKAGFISIILSVVLGWGLVIAAEQKEQINISPAMRAYHLRMAGKMEETQQLLEKAVENNPKDDLAYYELARVYFCRIYCVMNDESKDVKTRQKLMKGYMADADKAIQKAIKLNDKNPRYHYFAGIVNMYDSIYDMHFVWRIPAGAVSMSQMLNSYERALELKPDYHQARLMVLGLYDRLPWYLGGSKTKARKYVEQLKSMDAVYGIRGICELGENDKLDKVALWQELVEKLPADANAREGLMFELLDAGRTDMAVAEMEKAIELDPSKKILYLDFAEKLRKTKDYNRAAKYAELFLEQKGVELIFRAAALREMALIKEKQGDKEASQNLKKQADEITTTDYPTTQAKYLDLFTAP